MHRSTEYKHKLIEKGLCPKCGNVNDGSGYYCASCQQKEREYRRANKQFFKEIGVCIECGTNKAAPSSNYCEECQCKHYIYNRQRYLKNTEECLKSTRVSHKKRYEECKAQGICTRCKKIKADYGKTKCLKCLQKDANRHALKRKTITPSERKALNICRFCNNPVEDGYRVCKAHHQMCIEHNKIATQKRRAELDGLQKLRTSKSCAGEI